MLPLLAKAYGGKLLNSEAPIISQCVPFRETGTGKLPVVKEFNEKLPSPSMGDSVESTVLTYLLVH